jgi:hypothetical protein
VDHVSVVQYPTIWFDFEFLYLNQFAGIIVVYGMCGVSELVIEDKIFVRQFVKHSLHIVTTGLQQIKKSKFAWVVNVCAQRLDITHNGSGSGLDEFWYDVLFDPALPFLTQFKSVDPPALHLLIVHGYDSFISRCTHHVPIQCRSAVSVKRSHQGFESTRLGLGQC